MLVDDIFAFAGLMAPSFLSAVHEGRVMWAGLQSSEPDIVTSKYDGGQVERKQKARELDAAINLCHEKTGYSWFGVCKDNVLYLQCSVIY